MLFSTEAVTAIFIIFNTWVLTLQTFQLKNYNYIDTTTITQALSSTIFAHYFFHVAEPLQYSFFSVHATSLFFAILPFYGIFPNFIGIYTIQNILVYSPAVLLYFLFKKEFEDEKFAFVFSVSYLFYPGLFALFSAKKHP